MNLWWRNFLGLWFPPVCFGCNSTLLTGERTLCTDCLATMPVTYFHKTSNAVMRDLFYARIDVTLVASLFYYEKIGSVQRLIHQLKYKKQQHLSTYMGNWLGAELAMVPAFQNIDVVVPVPIHARRLQERGYNQVDEFGKAIAACLKARFCESALIKTRHTQKQSQLKQSKRISEENSPYLLNQSLSPGCHILLVDDVTTTGTTLVLCARELLKIPNVKISVATMAIAI